MKQIPATKGYVALVDDEDFERLSQYKWHARNSGAGRRPTRCMTVAGKEVVYFLSREIMSPPSGMVVDHINGDPWDNRRANLRVCTQGQNSRNRGPSRNNKLPYKGVCAVGPRFRAAIKFEGVLYWLGMSDNAEQAAVAYDAACLALHGEYARLNFPDLGTKPRQPTAPRKQANPFKASGL